MILFSDLDGTLLNNKKEIEESTMAAIDELLARGHLFACCTGRSLESAKMVARQYRLDREGCYMAAYNGGVIYEPLQDRILTHYAIPLPLVHKMFDEADAANLHVHTYGPNGEVLTRRHSPELDFYKRHTKLPSKTGIDVLDVLTEGPVKMIVMSLSSNERLKEFQRENEDWTAGSLDSFFSCEQYLEYCPAGVSKGAAMRTLCEYLDIPMEQTVAAGDERNDIPMLEAAGIAAVPANAHREVFATADYVCEKNNNQGAVGEIIRKFIL